jgi:hypothetical protein
MTERIRQLTEWASRWPVVALLAVPVLILVCLFNFHPDAVPYLQQAGNGVPPLDIHFLVMVPRKFIRC